MADLNNQLAYEKTLLTNRIVALDKEIITLKYGNDSLKRVTANTSQKPAISKNIIQKEKGQKLSDLFKNFFRPPLIEP